MPVLFRVAAATARSKPAFARESLQKPTFAYAERGRGRGTWSVLHGRMLTDVYVC
jgi:hypothetical protein